MAKAPSQEFSEVRVSKKGLEAVPKGRAGKVEGGFGDKKKVAILLGLALVAGGVVAYQFLGGSGPAPAKGAPTKPASPASAPAAAVSESVVESALEQLADPDPSPDDDALSVDRVEALVKKFDTYIQERQVPLKALRVNPFEVARVVVAHNRESKAQKKSDADAEAEARRERILKTASELKLGAVLIAGPTRTAVIEGELYRVGDIVEGLRVEAIESDHVTLAFEDERVNLRLRPDVMMR